jgi:putative transposase
VSYEDRKTLAAYLRKIYTAVDADHVADELTAFAEKWDGRYPMISASWLEHWGQISPFLAYPQDVRRVICAPNSIEPLHRQPRKIINTRGHFSTEDAARKLIYLAIPKAETRWQRVFHRPAALAAFKIQFGDGSPTTQCDCHYLTHKRQLLLAHSQLIRNN